MTLDALVWRLDAPCLGSHPDLWYPPVETNQRYFYEQARIVCRVCPVWRECLAAGETENHGMWGGLTPRERSGKRIWPHGSWVRYRQGCRCTGCVLSHDQECRETAKAS